MSNEELVHWEAARVDWDGEYYELAIRHGIQHPVSAWLNRWLGERLSRLAGMRGVHVRVSAAQWNKNGVGDWGEIVLQGIKTPWPDPEQLREHVLAAVREADQTTEIAEGDAQAFKEKLRAAAAVH
jgi:hypothetical protein